ncbi:MAG: type I restriction enzyme S subunit, partial [Phenylobacterium sp.]
DINIESTVGKINWHNLQTITNEVDEQYKKSRVTKGDILVIPTGFVIKIGFVDTDQPVNITRTIVRISPDITKCEPEYIHIYLNSPALQSWLASATSGISHRTLSSKTLKNTNIVLPPLPEQAEIVRQVTSSFDFANQIEQQVATAHVRMNELIQSILFEAFSGKLRSKP